MKKKRKKRFEPFFPLFRHPFSPFSHPNSVRLTIALLALAGSLGGAPAPQPLHAQSSGTTHTHDFVIFATVFNDHGFALFGAQARVRREDEKKFRWDAVADHSGELAIRVPQNAEYELTIEARGFQTQTRKIDAKDGNREDLTIRMEPQTAPQAEKGTGGKS